MSVNKEIPIASLNKERHYNTLERFIFFMALVIFFISGFAALLYQVIWQRMLGIFSGTDLYSITIIVSVYMAGLGCGNLVGGAIADRLTRRTNLLLFAGAELSISIFALISKPVYYDLLYLQYPSLANSPWILVITLFISLLWPTFFMGMSLPLLARALTLEIKAAAGTVGALYGLNTLGAAIGSLLTTWILLRQFSFETNLQIGAILNFSVALCAISLGLFISGRRHLYSDTSNEAPITSNDPKAFVPQENSVSLGLPFWLLIYSLSGFVALSLEILWFRLLGIMQKSTAFTFGTILSIYLVGLALGTFLGIPLAKRSHQPVRGFLILQGGIVPYACLSLALFVSVLNDHSYLRPLYQYFDHETMIEAKTLVAMLGPYPTVGDVLTRLSNPLVLKFLVLYFVLPIFLMGIPTLLMGTSFIYLQKVVQKDIAYIGRRVGWLQTSNIVGSTLGAMMTGWVLLPYLGTVGTLRLLLVLSGIFLFLWARFQLVNLHRLKIGAYFGTAAVVTLVGVIVPPPATLWSKLHGTTPDRIIFKEDGTGLSLVKSKHLGSVEGAVVFINGLSQGRIPYIGLGSMLGVVPAMLHPHPKEIAVIGIGSGNSLFRVGGRPETIEITNIEIVSSLLPALHSFYMQDGYPAIGSILNDRRINRVIADGRIYIAQRGEKYDIIFSALLRPQSAYAGNIYSEEFYRLILDHLKPGGLYATWCPTKRTQDTFIKVFPYVLSFPSNEIIIGSNKPINFNMDTINKRLDDPFTNEYYSQSLVDIKKTIGTLFKSHKVFFGPDFDRSVLTDTNSDLFAKDEFMIPYRLNKTFK